MNYVFSERHTYRIEADSYKEALELFNEIYARHSNTDEIEREWVCEDTGEEGTFESKYDEQSLSPDNS